MMQKYMVNKVLIARNGEKGARVRSCDNTQMFQVKGIESYIPVANDLCVDLRDGLVFRPSNAVGMVVDQQFAGDAANDRLNLYLRKMGIYQGETAHGFRAGSAIILCLTGEKLADIMEHVGW